MYLAHTFESTYSAFKVYIVSVYVFLFAFNGQYEADREVNGGKRG